MPALDHILSQIHINILVFNRNDESCTKKAMVVCQSEPQFYLNNLVNQIEKLTTKIDELDKKKNDQLIPIGFLYTQYPSQSSPDGIWPVYKWTEITSQYAGLFFRAEGDGSLPFGQTQQANQTWISDIKAEGSVDDSYKDKDNQLTSMNVGKWTEPYFEHSIWKIHFFTTDGEVRPKNTAIRIWKRTA